MENAQKNNLSFRDKLKGKKLFLFHLFRWIFVVALVLFMIFKFIIGFSFISGQSMTDTLQNNDFVIYLRNQSVNRGDIVSIALSDGSFFVKRVVAMGGDEVDLINGKVYVNGVAEDDSFLSPDKRDTQPEANDNMKLSYPYLVPDGYIFVLGDNRPGSTDSRFHGAFNIKKQVNGILLFRVGGSSLIQSLR